MFRNRPQTGLSRRSALKLLLAGISTASLTSTRNASAAEAVHTAVETAHSEIWRRFIDEYDILVDYTDLNGGFPRPTPEECQACKPNGLAWWTPVENGSMFNGMYLDAACNRWKLSGLAEDNEKARRLMGGLLRLASVGNTPGFIARGFATDGKTSYPMGSNDQTMPWLYGTWRYLREGLASAEERNQIVAKFIEVAKALESTGWKMPCSGPPAPFRGSFAPFTWEAAPRLLFLLKAAHQLSGDAHWDDLYREVLKERSSDPHTDRLEICRNGMVFHSKTPESWTGAPGVAALRGLWEMEEDPDLREAYAQGLRASARLAAESLPLTRSFDNKAQQVFLHDWRVLNEWWKPQHSEEEAVAVAMAQVRELGRRSPRRWHEFRFVREPLFAAWIVTLCPNRAVVEEHRAAILETLGHYDYRQLYYSQFFPAEAAWYRLRM